MGRTWRSRIGSRPRSVRGRNRSASWMSGASCSRFMIWVTRERHRSAPAPAYDTVVPTSRGWSPAVSLRGYFS